MILRLSLRRAVAVCSLVCAAAVHAAPPTVSNVRASQRAGTKLVDITYDVSDPDSSSLTVQIEMSSNSGATYDLPVRSLFGAVGAGVTPGSNRTITWNAGVDWNGNFSPTCRVRLYAFDNSTPVPPQGMVYIPSGTFVMGWESSTVIGGNVTLTKPYFMDRYEVSGSLWSSVRNWAVTRGYSLNEGAFREASHPVQSITWSDALMWCNARSEMEGLTPCYYTTAGQTTVLRSSAPIKDDMLKWNANGYRLPTEAEWERAARGGLDRKLYPWGNDISGDKANYSGSGDIHENSTPQTTPVGYYNGGQTPAGVSMANGYGLYDMAGNVDEMCWDWQESGFPLGQIDPIGPPSGIQRAIRGGSYGAGPRDVRCASRGAIYPESYTYPHIGFRTVRGF